MTVADVTDFAIMGVHLKPDDVLEEMNSLVDAYEHAARAFHTEVEADCLSVCLSVCLSICLLFHRGNRFSHLFHSDSRFSHLNSLLSHSDCRFSHLNRFYLTVTAGSVISTDSISQSQQVQSSQQSSISQ